MPINKLAENATGCLMINQDRDALEALLAVADQYAPPGSSPTEIVVVVVGGFTWFTARVGGSSSVVHGPHDDALESG